VVVRFGIGAAVALLAAFAPGCRAQPDASLLAEAWALGDEHRWAEAVPLLKTWLLDHPESVAGHFLYGQAYLHVSAPRFAVAIGQFRLARALADAQDGLGDIAGFLDQRTFRVTYHQKLALAHLRMAYEGMNMRFPDHLIRRQLELSLEEVEAGLALDPDQAFLLEMEETLREELVTDAVPPPGRLPMPVASKGR